MPKIDYAGLKKTSEELRKLMEKPQDNPVKLPPYIPLKPGMSMAVFLKNTRKKAK